MTQGLAITDRKNIDPYKLDRSLHGSIQLVRIDTFTSDTFTNDLSNFYGSILDPRRNRVMDRAAENVKEIVAYQATLLCALILSAHSMIDERYILSK